MKALSAMLILSISVAGLVELEPESTGIPASETIVDAPLIDARMAPFGPCVDDTSCGGNMHEMISGDTFQEDWHSCMEPAEHSGPACGVTFNPNEVLTAGAEQLAAMLRTPETNVSLNVARHAIQVRGCSGSIIAHLPLKDGAVAAIRSDL